MEKKQPGKNLSQLQEDREKAIKDLQTLQRQMIMIQGVVAYLNQEIQKLNGGVK